MALHHYLNMTGMEHGYTTTICDSVVKVYYYVFPFTHWMPTYCIVARRTCQIILRYLLRPMLLRQSALATLPTALSGMVSVVTRQPKRVKPFPPLASFPFSSPYPCFKHLAWQTKTPFLIVSALSLRVKNPCPRKQKRDISIT